MVTVVGGKDLESGRHALAVAAPRRVWAKKRDEPHSYPKRPWR